MSPTLTDAGMAGLARSLDWLGSSNATLLASSPANTA